MAYNLAPKDVAKLQQLVQNEIAALRANANADDEELAHAFELKGKLAKIAASRDDEPEPTKPERKPRAARGGNGKASPELPPPPT